MIILNYGNWKYSVDAVLSVLASGLKDYEVLVIDNNSPGDDYQRLLKAFAGNRRVRVLRTPRNLGFSGGHNYGTRHVKGRYIILLNDDTKVHRHWGNALVHALASDPQAAVAGSRAYYPQENPDVEHNRCALNVLFRHVLAPPEKRPVFVFADGASLAFDRAKIPRPFDDDYFLYHEDSYLSMLARLKGYRVLQVPESRVLHYGSASAGRISFRAALLQKRNRLFNVFLFYEASTLVRLLPLLLLDELAALAKNLVKKRGHVCPQVRAWLSFICWLPRLLAKRQAVQAQRKVPDSEALFPCLYGSVLPARNAGASAVNSMALAYLQLVGIRPRESYMERQAPKGT